MHVTRDSSSRATCSRVRTLHRPSDPNLCGNRVDFYLGGSVAFQGVFAVILEIGSIDERERARVGNVHELEYREAVRFGARASAGVLRVERGELQQRACRAQHAELGERGRRQRLGQRRRRERCWTCERKQRRRRRWHGATVDERGRHASSHERRTRRQHGRSWQRRPAGAGWCGRESSRRWQ